jgi:hypothetical protein
VSGLDELDVPRRNGELAFDAPWQSRAFGMAAAVVETRFGKNWEPFRIRLIAAIGADEQRPYWESWTAALEDLLVSAGLVSADELAAVTAASPARTGSRTGLS